MKHYVYKAIVIILSLIIIYHSTINYSIRNIKIDVINYFDKNKIVFFREKIKEEIKKSLDKENILQPADAKLLSEFINKIQNEIKNAK